MTCNAVSRYSTNKILLTRRMLTMVNIIQTFPSELYALKVAYNYLLIDIEMILREL